MKLKRRVLSTSFFVSIDFVVRDVKWFYTVLNALIWNALVCTNKKGLAYVNPFCNFKYIGILLFSSHF